MASFSAIFCISFLDEIFGGRLNMNISELLNPVPEGNPGGNPGGNANQEHCTIFKPA